VTDANLVPARLDPASFLGGAMALDRAAARAAISRGRDPLGFDADAPPRHSPADNTICGSIRVSLFEKGLDPRDFTMLSFGGAGSVMPAPVADELGIRRIIFPVDASTFSARGVLIGRYRDAFGRSVVRGRRHAVGGCVHALRVSWAEGRHGSKPTACACRRQSSCLPSALSRPAFELSVPWGDVPLDESGIGEICLRFHAQHV